MLIIMIANSGRFDSKGNIEKGFENFYYTLGTILHEHRQARLC
jgi:hypothetical protein